MALTLDASVWISAHSPGEPGHADSHALLDRILAESATYLSQRFFWSRLPACWREPGRKPSPRGLTDALVAMPFIRWVALDDALAVEARDLAASRHLRGADAVYAAVAAASNSVLVSLDHEQLTRLPPLVRTVTPSEALVLRPTP